MNFIFKVILKTNKSKYIKKIICVVQDDAESQQHCHDRCKWSTELHTTSSFLTCKFLNTPFSYADTGEITNAACR